MKKRVRFKSISIMPFLWVWLSAFVIVFSCSSCFLAKKKGDEQFSFGVIADCQYCKMEGTGVRKYSMSDRKLEECVAHFNSQDLAYTIHLGDFIDRDWESFDKVNPIYNKLEMPHYHVLGNHDFSVHDEKKGEVLIKMGLSSDYYDFEVKGWRFVILNGNDISFHAYPEGSERYKLAAAYYTQHKITSPKWNGAIGENQKRWLKQVLDKAANEEEKVILFCHFPVFPENVHNLWNASEIIEIIEDYHCVKAYMNGHNHEGNYGLKNGIHYLTFKGMVDTEENSYGMVKVNEDRLIVQGFGREENRTLVFRK